MDLGGLFVPSLGSSYEEDWTQRDEERRQGQLRPEAGRTGPQPWTEETGLPQAGDVRITSLQSVSGEQGPADTLILAFSLTLEGRNSCCCQTPVSGNL